MLFFWRKSCPDEQVVTPSPAVVEQKRKTHKAVAEADQSIKNVNQLLRANGITLQISVATGGTRRGH
jgi:hypothetical protein